MAEWLKLLAYALRSLFKSRARLEAENLVLRQQLDGEIRDLIRQMSIANPPIGFTPIDASGELTGNRRENIWPRRPSSSATKT